MEYSQDRLDNPSQHDMNSLIMEQASDIADELTQIDCRISKIICYEKDKDGFKFTDEAQDIFNVHYDRYIDELYKFTNAVIKTHSDNIVKYNI